MKKSFILAVLSLMPTLALAMPAFATVYIKYSNQDSQKHVMKVRMDGSNKEVTFEARTTGATTIQGSGRAATIETACGSIEIKDDSKIEIKDGCIKIQ
ncbi:hypothetical protein ACN4EG_23040 [Alkalinema pantanalense CENA528]|uniref:hypothetical protein n=1 Tax=Alkalinema pantanalense TaxID=1620705 RepID=UPI003D6F02A4